MVGHPDNPRKCVRDTSCTHIDECFAPYIDYGKNLTFDEMSEVNEKIPNFEVAFLIKRVQCLDGQCRCNVDFSFVDEYGCCTDEKPEKVKPCSKAYTFIYLCLI